MRVLIIGGTGQLGRALRIVYAPRDQVYAPGHGDLDITSPEQLRKAILDFQPELIVHAGAVTDVDGCETHVEEAFRVNALATRHLALLASLRDVPLVYVSTNYVFDGRKPTPYHEWDQTGPLSVYGLSKLGGEAEVRRHAPRYFIVRTAWLYGPDPAHRNFVRTMLGLADQGKTPLRVVADQWGQPTYAPDLAAAIQTLVATQDYGLFHLTSSGQCSWYEWAVELLRLAGRDVAVVPIPASEFPRAATPPTNGVLANWAAAALGITLPDWRDGLRRCLADMGELASSPASSAGR